MSTNPAFQQFASANAHKICRKFRGARDIEDQDDVLAELEFANAVLTGPFFQLRYEPYGKSGRRNPDFLVLAPDVADFNLEVKRVREGMAAKAIEAFQQLVVAEVRKVPSSLGFSLDILPPDEPVELANRLKESADSVVAQCVKAIWACEKNLGDDKESNFQITGFEEELRLTVSKVSGKPSNTPTAWFGGVVVVPYTQRESFKFTDVLLDCLGQLRPGMANVLAIRVCSVTHEACDLTQAIREISKRVRANDDEFFREHGFDGAADFDGQIRALSGVVMKSKWGPIRIGSHHNFVWENSCAGAKLAPDVVGHLIAM